MNVNILLSEIMYVLMIYLPGVETGAPHDDEQEGSQQSRSIWTSHMMVCLKGLSYSLVLLACLLAACSGEPSRDAASLVAST